MKHSRIIIVGFGPAGMACAIQLKRMGLETLVIEKNRPGGMLFNANRIENYPGFPGGVTGEELVRLFSEQTASFQIDPVWDDVQVISYRNGSFGLKGAIGIYQGEILIVASGTVPVIPEKCPLELVKEGLIHFDISHIKTVQSKVIGIVGAGDAAFDYSLTMAENDNEVIIFNRGDRIRALKILREKVFINNKIKYLQNTTLEDLETLPGKGLSAICHSASSNSKYLLDYLIFATGRKPADYFFHESIRDNLLDLTIKRRLYMIGDINNGHYRQVSVAVGDGVKAAMEIFRHESNQ
jgi:thioredoxin reductase (NADPH)